MFKRLRVKVAAAVAGVVAAITPVVAFADDPTAMESLTDSMLDGFGSAVADILGAIGALLPVLIPVAAAIALITVGYALFKRFGRKG
jgi:hypothetical protein